MCTNRKKIGKPNGASWGGHGFPWGAPPGIAIRMDSNLMSKVKIESTESSKSTVSAAASLPISSNQADDVTKLSERPECQTTFQDIETKASTLTKLMDVDVDMNNRMNQ